MHVLNSKKCLPNRAVCKNTLQTMRFYIHVSYHHEGEAYELRPPNSLENTVFKLLAEETTS